MGDKLSVELDKLDLSISEKQIVEGVVMGLSNAEIANQTFKNETTIKIELEEIKAKLGYKSRATLIVDFLQHIEFYK